MKDKIKQVVEHIVANILVMMTFIAVGISFYGVIHLAAIFFFWTSLPIEWIIVRVFIFLTIVIYVWFYIDTKQYNNIYI